MEKEKKELKYCPFRLTNEPQDCPGWSKMTPEERHSQLIKNYGCLEDRCQWWWLCCGNNVDEFYQLLDDIRVTLIDIRKDLHAQK